MTKASELREMSDEQLALTLNDTTESFSGCGCRPRPSGWTLPASSASTGADRPDQDDPEASGSVPPREKAAERPAAGDREAGTSHAQES